MAHFKYQKYLQSNNSEAFDAIHTPGTVTPYSGIYKCVACGLEIVSEAAKPLPPQHSRQHAHGIGAIRWKLEPISKLLEQDA